jgi:hypothetical protein
MLLNSFMLVGGYALAPFSVLALVFSQFEPFPGPDGHASRGQ